MIPHPQPPTSPRYFLPAFFLPLLLKSSDTRPLQSYDDDTLTDRPDRILDSVASRVLFAIKPRSSSAFCLIHRWSACHPKVGDQRRYTILKWNKCMDGVMWVVHLSTQPTI